ncbi:phosphatase PAP2 family protein [bacterium]|nr:phosphatase PAP2 family protein [bacterium]
MIKKTVSDNIWFILPFLIFQTLAIYTVPFEDKVALFEKLNANHTTFLDYFFKIMSGFVEWYGWVLTALIALFIRVRFGIFAVVAMLLSGLASQLLKHQVFFYEKRPSFYITPADLQLVEGIDLHTNFSFPSGHTTAAFSIFFILSLLISKKFKPVSLLLFIMALLVGYSRVYLNQHFPIDVVAGAALGTLVTLLVYWLAEWFFNRKAYNWAEKSFLALFTSLG